jgi:hypothetical protein
MTIDTIQPSSGTLAVLDPTSDGLVRLGQWVEAANNAHRLVKPLVATAFVPDAYRPKFDPRATDKEKAEAYEVAVANATAAVLYGISLGIDPLTALQQIYIVHGRPGMYAKLMVALVQSRGHDLWTDDLSDTRAVVAGRRKGSDIIERVTVTMEMARKAGWTSNQAYGKTPQDMLWARAAARVCDRIASDVIKGIPSVEQVEDEQASTTPGGTRTVRPPARRVEAIQHPPLPAEEPSLEDEPTESTPDPAPSKPITQAQQRALHAALRDTGRADRDLGLVYISGVIGREVESAKDLTTVEASAVIDALKAETEPQTEEPTLDGDWPATPEVQP